MKILAPLDTIIFEIRRLRANTQVALSVPHAAWTLDTSDKTVSRWIAEGRITPIPDTGRRVLIARVELERFAAADGRYGLSGSGLRGP